MCLAVHPTNRSTIYAGSLSSQRDQPGGCGVWKTTNGGASWNPIADDLPSLQVADIAIDSTAPSRVYAAIVDRDRAGAGLYLSENGGSGWTQVTTDSRLNGRTLLIDPANASVMYMAGRDAVYRSSDGGVSWNPVLDEAGGVITDLVMDRSNPQRLYAGVLGSTSGVGGLYATRDSGSTWDRLTGCPGQRLPNANMGTTVRLAMSGSRMYAAFKTSDDDWILYRTTGVGCIVGGRAEQAWERRWQAGPEVGRTIWSFLYADPADSDFVYATGTNFRVSTDGGMTFSVASGPHVDHHAFATDPTNPKIIYTGCDGGIYKSSNHGSSGSWSFIGQGMAITEMYDLAHAPTDSRILISGTQDNGTIRYLGPDTTWKEIRGGDGAGVEIDPTDEAIFFGVGQYASSIARSKDGGSFQGISQGLPIGTDCFDMPFLVHPKIPTILLASCGRALWRTTTSAPPGDWKRVFEPGSGSVTRSAVDPATDLYVAGTSRGELFAGPSGTDWARVFSYAESVPGGGSPVVTDLQFDVDTPGAMFATFNADGAGRVFRLNVGESTAIARDITSNLPSGARVRTVALDRMRRLSLFVGLVQGGVYHGTSNDSGTTWHWRPYIDGMPAAADIRRLLAHPITGVLRAGTYGRGAFDVDTDWPLGSVLAMEGRVTELRAHERGSMFGPPTDRIDAEVVFRLDADPRKAFGFQLRQDAKEPAHRSMLDVLRDAFRGGGGIRVDYTRTGISNNVAIRVIRVS
ncbi:WD40/YVTN/BNR-like repeat-containing protein [Streptomyces sp. NPDC054866]